MPRHKVTDAEIQLYLRAKRNVSDYWCDITRYMVDHGLYQHIGNGGRLKDDV